MNEITVRTYVTQTCQNCPDAIGATSLSSPPSVPNGGERVVRGAGQHSVRPLPLQAMSIVERISLAMAASSPASPTKGCLFYSQGQTSFLTQKSSFQMFNHVGFECGTTLHGCIEEVRVS